MYVAACHITGRDIPASRRERMVDYLAAVQAADGSLGLHVEAPGSMFTTSLGYVALRLLGVSPDDVRAARMRHWIRSHGSPLGAASWGKLVLALLSLYDYEGLHPILPELWLLPRSVAVHPSRLWCHCRQVYLPMAYLYAVRAQIPESGLVRQLRQELYDGPYEQIRFQEHRDTLAVEDRLVPGSTLLGWANRVMAGYERHHSARLRARAQAELLRHIDFEDQATSFIRIGPVNAVLNTIAHHFRADGAQGERLSRSLAALDSYLCEYPEGVAMNGYNSTALWDTAFAVQSILATPFAERHAASLMRAYEYIRDNQVLEDLLGHELFHRHRSRGGWPFSDRAHGWPISDCTAEGLTCALALEPRAVDPIARRRLEDAVELLLAWQNADGGWPTYELQRGGAWLERLNPSQLFARIMVDYSYVECTAACLHALAAARQRLPARLHEGIAEAVRRGEAFLRRAQTADGGFEGSWAVCFTYGTWFGVRGLRAAGAAPADPAIQRACRFLLGHQRADGAWGEHFQSCLDRRYVQHREGQVVNTAWALLALQLAGRAEEPGALSAASFLVEQQQDDGGWPKQSLTGVFNRTTLIDYDNYRRYFPIWALARYC
jgi:squalene/oxidosqualene cyclase-like protein